MDVTSYLSRPSCALFATAMSATSPSWQNYNLVYQPSATTKAIVSSTQWETLDFEGVEKDLAAKLADADIFAVLQCTNAKDMLRKLKLAGCVNITGGGLMPLTGSIVLEQIDLSLVDKHAEYQHIYPLPKIMEDVVLPIFDSIIAVDGCVLKHIQFPTRKWQQTYRIVDQEVVRRINQFWDRYNHYLNNRGLSCAVCDGSMENSYLYFDGQQDNMCYVCLKPFCKDCESNLDNIRCCGSSCRK